MNIVIVTHGGFMRYNLGVGKLHNNAIVKEEFECDTVMNMMSKTKGPDVLFEGFEAPTLDVYKTIDGHGNNAHKHVIY